MCGAWGCNEQWIHQVSSYRNVSKTVSTCVVARSGKEWTKSYIIAHPVSVTLILVSSMCCRDPAWRKRRAERAACPEQVAVSDVGLFTGDDRLTVPVGDSMVCWEDLCNPGVTRSASQAVYGMGWTMKMKRTPTKTWQISFTSYTSTWTVSVSVKYVLQLTFLEFLEHVLLYFLD